MAKYDYWISNDGLQLLAGWARLGLTDEQIAHNMGIARSTLNEWKKKRSDISDALKKNKETADMEVENALFKKATGIKETVLKAFKLKRTIFGENGKKIRDEEYIELTPEEVYVPPDTTAQIFWLKNRQPERWRDKQEVQHSGSIESSNPFKDLTTEELRKLIHSSDGSG